MRYLVSLGLLYLIACDSDKAVTVYNPAPVADIISHEQGSEVYEQTATIFVGSVTDANHTADQLVTIWYLDGVVVCDDVIPNENGETRCEMTLAMNDSDVTLAVRDPENARSEDTVGVSVVETAIPEAEIVSPVSDGVYYSDQLIAFEAVVSDAEDEAGQLVAS